MMRRRLGLGGVVLVCSFVVLLAGEKDFWAAKPYGEWSEKEVEKLLKNSPWSKTVTVGTGSMSGRGGGLLGPEMEGEGGGFPRGGGQGGDPDNPTQGGSPVGGGGGGMGRRSGGGSGGFPTAPAPTITIAWNSKPIRQAFARRLQLRNPETSQEQLEKFVSNENTSHIEFVVMGWRGTARGVAPDEAIQRLREETFLQKKNKEKLPLADLVLPASPGQPMLLRFTRESNGKPAVTLEDKEVELVVRVGANTVRAKFKLADMVIGGQLES